MKMFLNANFPSQLRNRMKRLYRVILPALTCGENLRSQTNAQVRSLRLNAGHVFGPDVDRLVKDCDGFEFRNGFERRAQIGFVTLGIRWRKSHIDVQASLLRGV